MGLSDMAKKTKTLYLKTNICVPKRNYDIGYKIKLLSLLLKFYY